MIEIALLIFLAVAVGTFVAAAAARYTPGPPAFGIGVAIAVAILIAFLGVLGIEVDQAETTRALYRPFDVLREIATSLELVSFVAVSAGIAAGLLAAFPGIDWAKQHVE